MPASKKYETEKERIAAARKSRQEWAKRNRQKINETERARRASRSEEEKERERNYRKEYRAKNIDAVKIRNKKVYEKNKEIWILSNIKKRAREQGLPFDLTAEDIKPPEFCPVLHIKLERGTKKTGPLPNSPSVDRIVPELGYVRGNIIVISHLANAIKQNASPDQIRKVADFFDRLQSKRGIIELRNIERGWECL